MKDSKNRILAETSNDSPPEQVDLGRRQALARLGLTAAVAYAAPAVLPLNRAAAESGPGHDGNGGSDDSGPGGSNSGGSDDGDENSGPSQGSDDDDDQHDQSIPTEPTETTEPSSDTVE